jgi:hypothetical protein
MLDVAKANGFESISQAIAEAKAARVAAPPKPCLHVRLNVNVCEDCGARFDLRS